jgi:hypothetical protein
MLPQTTALPHSSMSRAWIRTVLLDLVGEAEAILLLMLLGWNSIAMQSMYSKLPVVQHVWGMEYTNYTNLLVAYAHHDFHPFPFFHISPLLCMGGCLAMVVVSLFHSCCLVTGLYATINFHFLFQSQNNIFFFSSCIGVDTADWGARDFSYTIM